MLRDSLDRLARADYSFHDTYEKLRAYFATHPDWGLIDPTIIARDLPQIDPFTLADALDEAVRNGELRAKYTVLTPDGVVASDLFDSPQEIPRRLADRFEETFQTRDYPVVAVFEAADASEEQRSMEAGS
jgi:hypothetical protein